MPSGSRPQTQAGRSGGHTHPRARACMNRLTMRSSSEWNEMHHESPAGRQQRERLLEATLQDAELVVHDDAKRLEDPLGRVPPANSAGVGIAPRMSSTSSHVETRGALARWRTIARAMGRA